MSGLIEAGGKGETKGQVQQDNFGEKVERNMEKNKQETQKHETEISQLSLQFKRSKIEALKRGIPQITKGLAAYAESLGSKVVNMERESVCVMCMNEHPHVVARSIISNSHCTRNNNKQHQNNNTRKSNQ
ncbi:hypothetical protein H5410_048027 [Solanum commersonii]|uniref:Uncharacterized protein n=1 Tax=Solanum commersonii TaxID=4109 RepID=A0A9J5XGW4_SOLCO|nr:hypothetical protein H5410_048027 [Solanum commersonii]